MGRLKFRLDYIRLDCTLFITQRENVNVTTAAENESIYQIFLSPIPNTQYLNEYIYYIY